jgi:GH15 family glucan-1,4-alpha-glucosidase
MGSEEGRGYRPISDYALIGDAHTAALVSTDGSIDWLCWPRFDSPAVLCRLLDARKGGWFQVRPARDFKVAREYSGPTAVLAATFDSEGGRFRLTDFMPVERLTKSHRGEDIAAVQSVHRLVEGLGGSVEVELSFRPTFDFALAPCDIDLREGGAVARSGRESLVLSCPFPLTVDEEGVIRGRFRVSEGERVWVALYYKDGDGDGAAATPLDSDAELERTRNYWDEWWCDCRYEGPYRDLVRRSALTLKLLTYEPTGALVAAPTTSLPEKIGGVRNWDYRYTWLRDSALTLYALQLLGYEEEAADFFGWLDRLCITCRDHRLQIMYTIDGESQLPERELNHLEGYRGSRPVRVGNAAFGQMQLDVYGEVLDAAHLYHERTRRPVRAAWWDELRFMADETARRWREPDHGIWEVRGGKQHFLHSKLMCWVALDRAVRLAADLGAGHDAAPWVREREELRRAILKEGYHEGVGAFTQSFGSKALDASALVIPLTGFLPATDPRVLSTVERIRERLTSRGLVYRYLSEDGLPGDEATFAMCSFWLAETLALQGRIEEARELFERVASYASDTGLFAEQIEPESGELLGNYPQGFTHLALIRAALHIAKAESHGPEDRAQTSVERAGKVEGTGSFPKPPRRRS